SDGTVSLEGQRFELPSRFRLLSEVHLRYARWDLSRVDLVDPRSGAILSPLRPLDKAANADAQRRCVEPTDAAPSVVPESGVAPHLKQMIADYAATGLPPAYLPTTTDDCRNRAMNQRLLALYGLKWNPFTPDVPTEALYVPPQVENFCWRIEQVHLREGGFALVHGDPGSGKSVVMRVLAERLSRLADLSVGVIHHPQSNLSDFYRELGDIFGISIRVSNRWGGFKALRARWLDHLGSCSRRSVILIDEAQEMSPVVLN